MKFIIDIIRDAISKFKNLLIQDDEIEFNKLPKKEINETVDYLLKHNLKEKEVIINGRKLIITIL